MISWLFLWGNMIKDFKCTECGIVKELKIPTADITGNHGKLNLKALDERLREKRYCDCGGEMHPQLTTFSHMVNDPFFYDGYSHRHPKHTTTDHNVIHNRNRNGV